MRPLLFIGDIMPMSMVNLSAAVWKRVDDKIAQINLEVELGMPIGVHHNASAKNFELRMDARIKLQEEGVSPTEFFNTLMARHGVKNIKCLIAMQNTHPEVNEKLRLLAGPHGLTILRAMQAKNKKPNKR